MGETFFIICYPGGDESKISVAEISRGMEYEKSDYRLASRHDYDTREEAVDNARKLAKMYGLTYIGGPGDNHFLD